MKHFRQEITKDVRISATDTNYPTERIKQALTAKILAPEPTPVLLSSPAILTGMSIDWTTIIVAVVTGVTTGLIAPIISPFANWYIQKKERQEETHRKIIQKLRQYATDQSIAIDMLLGHHYFPYVKYGARKEQIEKLAELENQYSSRRLEYIKYEFKNKYKKDLNEFSSGDEYISSLELWISHLKSDHSKITSLLRTESDDIEALVIEMLVELERKWGLVSK